VYNSVITPVTDILNNSKQLITLIGLYENHGQKMKEVTSDFFLKCKICGEFVTLIHSHIVLAKYCTDEDFNRLAIKIFSTHYSVA